MPSHRGLMVVYWTTYYWVVGSTPACTWDACHHSSFIFPCLLSLTNMQKGGIKHYNFHFWLALSHFSSQQGQSTSQSSSSRSGGATETHRTVINAQTVPQSYNEKVLLFLRQPNIMDILKTKQAAISHSSSSLRTKVNAIREHGIDILERLSNDVELIILLRLVTERFVI